MKSPLIPRIARRLSLSAEGHRSSPAVRVATAAVALSVAVMLASLAIVRGFKQQISDKVTGFNAHMSVTAPVSESNPSPIMTLTPSLRNLLDSLPYIRDYSLQAAMPAILKTSNDFKGVYLKAADSGTAIEFLRSNLEDGTIPHFNDGAGSDSIVISGIQAKRLGLKTGDKIETYFITDDVRVRKLHIAGIYNSHFDSYDDLLMFGPMSLISSVGNLSGNEATAIQIYTVDFRQTESFTADLRRRLDQATAQGVLFRNYRVDNALHQGASYFQWLALLDTNVAVILTLMTLVACVTLISGMLIIILDKTRIIALLRTLGMTASSVSKVFVLMALRVALTGMMIGNAVMLTLLYVQDQTHFIPLDPESYYIDFVPVSIYWPHVVMLNAGVIIIAWMSLLLPSRYVARISPARVIPSE